MATPRQGKPKKVGYVELEWVCPRCSTRNRGSRKLCEGCGAPQPENVQFEQPLDATVIAAAEAEAAGAAVDPAKPAPPSQASSAQAVAAAIAAGPDIHCPYCGARNAATNKVCVQCQAPLEGAEARQSGANLGAVSAAPAGEVRCNVCGSKNPAATTVCARCGAPMRRPQKPAPSATPASPQRGGAAIYWIIGAAVVLIAVVGLLAWLGFRSERHEAIVQEARWERSIAVLGLMPVEKQAWAEEVPAGAETHSCRDVVRYTSPDPVAGGVEVCGEPYTVDTGTGFGEVYQDCEYQVYDQMCSYSTLQWIPVDTVVQSGTGFNAQWPALSLAPDRQAGDRSERYQCVFGIEGDAHSLNLSADEYPLCQPGSRWLVEINGLGSIVSAEPE